MAFETVIIYQGPSLIDGEEIVVMAQRGSRNRKTGAMLQTFILRVDVDPVTASREGKDFSICGSCPHRGQAHDGDKGQAKNRSCYVTLAHSPLTKYKCFKRGGYAAIEGHAALAAFGKGEMVRIGTYGDGAAVPSYIWESLCSEAKGWTAYTHQSGMESAASDPKLYMTSVESEVQAKEAWLKGERTFRVIADVSQVVKGREILCPASEEMGKRSTCETCGLCAGASLKAKSIAIVAHGTSKKAAKQLVAA
ncbi:hypothetical protein ACQU0X_08555 [Pseudovibrio ascidiaceicola]|uniref:hypothetical protein n=1 Tax=Pseudovibrio ascidiaceicola TaxID=285279 RepID=UPI003D35E031